VNKGFVKTPLVGLVFVFVAEVPFAEDAGSIARRLEDLGQDGGLERHALPFQDRVGDAVFLRVPTRHDRRAGGRAGGRDEKSCEARAGVVEGIELRRPEPGMPVATQGGVALVVGHDEDDVGSGAGQLGERRGDEGDQQE
jgi:hypothetical protein